jgi:hypothetical protein
VRLPDSIQVVTVHPAAPTEELLDVRIDRPLPGARIAGRRLTIKGDIVGRHRRAVTVEVRSQGARIAQAPINLERRRATKRHADTATARQAGFRVDIEAQGSGTSELTLVARLEGGPEIEVGSLRVSVGGNSQAAFLVGEELPGDEADQTSPAEATAPAQLVVAGDVPNPAPVEAERDLRGRGAAVRSPMRWLGVIGLGLGIIALAAVVLSRGGEEPRQPVAAAGQQGSGRLVEKRTGNARPERVGERRADRLRERREERIREERSRERRERRMKRERGEGEGQVTAPAAPEPAPAAPPPESEPVAPQPVPAPAPEPVAAPAPETATTPVATAPAPSEPAPAPEPEPTAESTGSGSDGGSSCGPYDIGC